MFHTLRNTRKSWLENIFSQLLALSILICSCLLFNVLPALAHTPHDDVFQVEISPQYDLDKTLFTIVRGNLFKSKDGGENWQTLINGLDHKHRLYSLEIADKSPDTLYLSSLGDGVYKSQNGGDSWLKVNRGLNNFQIDLLKISDRDPDLVLAAGLERGLYQTEDGGNNWHLVINSNQKINALAFTPDDETIFAGDKQGNLLVSNDRGNVWQTLANFNNLNQESISAIAISPNFSQNQTLWLGTAEGKIYQSIDGGISLREISKIDGQPILSLAVAPKDSQLYAVAGYQGVFKSSDGGNSWQELSRGLTADSQADKLERPYYSDLAISPQFERDNTLFLAGYDGLFQSPDGGKVWQEQETLSTRTIVGLGISPNYSKDGTVAVGTYVWGGYLSGDRGANWHGINGGLIESQRLEKNTGISRVFDTIFSPQYSTDGTIFFSTWYGIHKSTDRGNKWQNRYWWQIQPQNEPWWTEISQGVTVAVSPNYKRDRTVYLGTMDGHILQSTNGGKSFSLISQLDAVIVDLIVSPNFKSDRTVYAAVPQKIYRSIDGGNNWTLASNGIIFNEQYDPKKEAIMQLAISPNFKSDRTILVGTPEGIFQTNDRGDNWQKLTNTVYGDDSYIEGVAISPDFQNDRTVIASVRGKGLFKTIDGGQTFTAVGNELIENNIALANLYGFSLTGASAPIQFSPNYQSDRTIFGFSDKTLFKSQDAGNTWQAITLPIPEFNWLTYLYFDYLYLTIHSKLLIALTSSCSLLIYLLFRYWRTKKKFQTQPQINLHHASLGREY